MDMFIFFTTDYSMLSNITFWNSGYDKDGPGKYSWCSANNTPVGELNWKEGKVGSTAGCLRVFFPPYPKPNATNTTTPARKFSLI